MEPTQEGESDELAFVEFAMFAKVPNDELAAAAGGRRPEA